MAKKAAQPNRAARVDQLEDQFVAEYFAAGMNGTRAYLRTYPNSTHHAARANAAKVLARTSVKAKIAAHKRRLAKEGPVSGTDVIAEMAKVAFADIGDVIDFRGPTPALRPGKALPPDARAAISSVEVTTRPARVKGGKPTVTAKVRMYDKLRALDKIGVMLGLWEEKHPAEKILEKLLASLPPAQAAALRLDLARLVGGGGGDGPPAALGPRAGTAEAAGPDADGRAGVPVGRADGGPVAAEVPGGPAPAATGDGLPAGGEDGGVGGEDLASLFDD